MSRRIVGSVVTAIIVSITVASCTLRPPASGHPIAGGSQSETCAECHGEIYNEWRTSAHASAYTREEFHLAARKHEETDCLPCHVPISLDSLTEQPVRTSHLEEGINCESCHLTGDTYAAPEIFSSYANHNVVVKKELAASEFCGKCHQSIFEQWSKVDVTSEQRKSCQDCHMPIIRRRTVAGSPWHKLHPKVDTRHHGFAMVKPEPGEANITVEVAFDRVSPEHLGGTITLTNVSAHHSLPSGEYGFRELAVVVALTDRYGVASAKQVVRFLAQKRKFLGYRMAKVVDFSFDAVPADVEAIKVELLRSAFSGVEAVLYHERYSLPQAGRMASSDKSESGE